MNSTESRREAALRSFYTRELVPSGLEVSRRGVRFFPLGPEPDTSTYYSRRTEGADYIHELDAEQWPAALLRRWTEEGYPELTTIVPALARLAAQIGEAGEENGEVSPLIYAMF